MPEALYLTDDRTTDTARVLSCEPSEEGLWVVRLDLTIFHPQGGGQPSDCGTVDDAQVQKVLHSTEGIVHLLDKPVSGEVELVVDQEVRKLNSRLHSAGHIVGLVGDRLGWHAIGGNHFPGESRVIFNPEDPSKVALISSDEYEAEVNRLISLNLDRVVKFDSDFRTVTWGDWEAYPCGGTHVTNTSEIGLVKITKIKQKKDRITVSYSLQ